MKKIFVLVAFMFSILLTGCNKEEYFTCKIDLYNDIQQYNLNAEYKIYYKDSYVTKIEKEEVYTTNKKDTLEYFNEYKNLEYKNLNNLYGGVIHTVELKENKVKLNASMDMSLIDIKKMIKDDYIDKDYVISGKLTTSGIKNIYKSKGAICDI